MKNNQENLFGEEAARAADQEILSKMDKAINKSLEPKIKESVYQKEIWDLGIRMGWYPCKIENQATFDPAGFRRNFAGGTKRNGMSDLFLFVGGRVIFCEVKVPEKYAFILRNWDKIKAYVPKPKVKGEKKKPKPEKQRYQEQMRFLERSTELGQIGFFADGARTFCQKLLENSHLLNLSPAEKEEISRLAL